MNKSINIRALYKKEFIERTLSTIPYSPADLITKKIVEMKDEIEIVIKTLLFDQEINEEFYKIIWKEIFERKESKKNNKETYITKSIYFSNQNVNLINTIFPLGFKSIFVEMPWLIRGWIIEEIIKNSLKEDNVFKKIKYIKERDNNTKNSIDNNKHQKEIQQASKENPVKNDKTLEVKKDTMEDDLDQEDFKNILQF